MNFSFWHGDQEFRLSLEEKARNDILVSVGERKYRVSFEFLTPDEILLNINGKIHNVIINSNSFAHSVYVNRRFFKIEKKSVSKILGKESKRPRKRNVVTSMPGKIVKVYIEEGQEVKEGQPVLVLEAMKMQNEIKSPQSGKVTKINPRAGESVEAGAVLFSVE